MATHPDQKRMARIDLRWFTQIHKCVRVLPFMKVGKGLSENVSCLRIRDNIFQSHVLPLEDFM
jgi:hypothetical protein